MGIHFYDHDQFPLRYRHAAFIALHAGHAKLAPIEGYSVITLFADPDGGNARVADFITGFQTGTEEEEVWGYPMGITTDAAGNLYVSSDLGNRGILRIEYSPIIADWRHNLPDTLYAGTTLNLDATVQIERLAADAEPPVVSVDLSALGGPGNHVLDPVDGNTFRIQLGMTAPINVDGPQGRVCHRAAGGLPAASRGASDENGRPYAVLPTRGPRPLRRGARPRLDRVT